MQLLYNPLSPFARKCRIIVIEKGLENRLQLVSVVPYDNPPALLAINPLSTVPALITDDGLKLCDSTVICEYLDALTPEPSFYPQNPDARFKALALATLADGIAAAAVTCVVEKRRPVENQSIDWIVRKGAAVQRGISAIAEMNIASADVITIGDIALASALGYVAFRMPDINWQENHGALAEWLADISMRPSFAATAPKA
jgi:glutathione S-transferase